MKRSGILPRAAAVTAALAVATSAFNAQGQSPNADNQSPSASDTATGKSLYEQHCAACHDHPSGRTPPRAVIEDKSRAAIASTLTDGIMKPMAGGLSANDIAALASFLSERENGALAEGAACSGTPPPMSLSGAVWNGWGNDIVNSRFQPYPGIAAADVPRLKLKWAFHHAGGSSGQATIAGGRVFTNSSSGSVYSLDAKRGCVWWRFAADGGTRTSIVIGALPGEKKESVHFAAYFADQSHNVYALDAESGDLLWKTRADDQTGAMMTGSLALYRGHLFVPVSSAEEALARDDNYECCKFRGAVVALDAATGRLLWKTYTTAREPKPFRKNARGTQMYGPAGGAIWSAPTVDALRHLIYVATGDSYTDVPHEGSDAIMALDAETGAVRWVNQLTADDNFIIGCGRGQGEANCPTKLGRDSDFGASPILVALPNSKDAILAAQKSGEIYALDPDNRGAVLWHQRLSPGGPLGGVEFGVASDGTNLYVPISDMFLGPFGKPGLSAVRLSDAKILWNWPSPSPAHCAWTGLWCAGALSQAITVIPGIVFAGSMDGHFRAYDTATGKVVFDDDTGLPHKLPGGDVSGGGLDGAGPTIAGGMVYVTSGYQGRTGVSGSVLLAYSVDGK